MFAKLACMVRLNPKDNYDGGNRYQFNIGELCFSW